MIRRAEETKIKNWCFVLFMTTLLLIGGSIIRHVTVLHAETAVTYKPVITVDLNFVEDTITVEKSDSMEPFQKGDVIYYCFTVNKKGEQTKPKEKDWVAKVVDKVESDKSVKIDISWVKISKVSTLFVCTDTDEEKEIPVDFEVYPPRNTLKIVAAGEIPKKDVSDYIGNNETGYLYVKSTKSEDDIGFSGVQYKTLNGNCWKEISELDLASYCEQGTTLQFRYCPDDFCPAGKVVTVKIPAKAAAPKVKVDYGKQTIEFKAGQEYIEASEYGKDTTTSGGSWTKVTAKTTKYFSELGYTGKKKIIYVRTSATAKKAPSKIATVVWKDETRWALLGDDYDEEAECLYKADMSDGVFHDLGNKLFGDELYCSWIRYKVPYDSSSGLYVTNFYSLPGDETEGKNLQVAIVKMSDLKSRDAIMQKENKDVLNHIGLDKKLGLNDSKSIVKWYSVGVGIEKVNPKGADIIYNLKSATIPTKGLDVSDCVILYRWYNMNDKTLTAPSRIYMAEMPDTVEQQLMFCTGYAGKETYYDVTNPLIIKVGESAEELRQRLVGPYIDLNYSCKSKNPKCTAKVYTNPDCTTQTKDLKITVKSDLDQSLLMCCSYWPEITANKAGTYYIKFTAESASKVIKVVVS